MEKNKVKKIVAVTSCPTGVAHTFMAAKAIEVEAKKRGIEVHVQKNAQSGIEDALTKKQIDEADVVLISADVKVDTSNFIGKQFLSTNIKNILKNTSKVFDQLEKGVPILKGEKVLKKEENVRTTEQTFKDECKNIAKRSYSQLLTGVSHMLPFVVAGGILIAISFFWGIWSFDKTNHPSKYVPFAGSLKTIGDAAFTLMVPILAGYLAYSIGDRPALVPGMVGGYLANNGFEDRTSGFIGAIVAGYAAGWLIILLKRGTKWVPKSMNSVRPIIIYPLISTIIIGLLTIWGINYAFDPLFNVKTGLFHKWLVNMQDGSKVVLALVLGLLISVDFGGPVNKVAYLFGVAALTDAVANGNKSDVMAAVSAGCMVPPISTFIATTIFRNRFSGFEKQAGISNLILGAFHITEGAIPFAAKKPWINIPIFMLGSSVACVMSMLFGASTSAPHGGIVVIALVNKWYWWLLSIVAGSFATGILLGMVSKKDSVQKNNVIFSALGG